MSNSVLLALAATSGLSTIALGLVAPENVGKTNVKYAAMAVGQKVIRPTLQVQPLRIAPFAKGMTGVEVQWDVRSGAARLVTGADLGLSLNVGSKNGEDFVKAALAYVDSRPELFGLDSRDLTLNQDALLVDEDVQFVSFRVSRDGVPITDACIQFRFKKGNLVQIQNASFAEAKSDVRASLSGLEEKTASMAMATKIAKGTNAFRVEETKSGYRLVRVVSYQVETVAGESLTVETSAATGEIFESRDNRHFMEGEVSGQFYERYYSEPLLTNPLDLVDVAGAGGAARTNAQGRFSAQDGTTPKVAGLKGQYVSVTDKKGQFTREGAQLRDLWTIVLDKKTVGPAYEGWDVANAMAYYHTSKIIQYAQNWIHPDWFNSALTANVNLSDTCNAHWDGTTINFYSAGESCANTGLISDVMYHEWGHGLDANTGGLVDGAYSEGFGDIVSMIMTKSHVLGIGFRTNGDPVRDLEPNAHFPEDRGEVHREGLIIGSTFWDLFKGLIEKHGEAEAQTILAKLAFKMIYTAEKYTDVYPAILVIDDDDANPANGTPNKCIINAAFSEHGLAEKDAGCSLAAIEAFDIDDSAGNNNGVIEPGETVKINVRARNDGADAIEGMTGIFTVTENDRIRVAVADVAFPSVPAQSVGTSTNPLELAVAADAVCGSSFNGKMVLTAGPRQAIIAQAFNVGRALGTPEKFSGESLPVAIKDNLTVYSPAQITGAQWEAGTLVQEAHLKFEVTHSYIGDLKIGLVAPDGKITELYRGAGDGRDVHFDKDVSVAIAGQVGPGQWKIYVNDSASRDEGSLTSFELTLTPRRYICE
jgi:hypothetical protein